MKNRLEEGCNAVVCKEPKQDSIAYGLVSKNAIVAVESIDRIDDTAYVVVTKEGRSKRLFIELGYLKAEEE